MANFLDFTFNHGQYGAAEEKSGVTAVILAIKNIILSRPGNFPRTPSLGIDIEKFQFDFADEKTANTLKTEIMEQISKYIPSLDNVLVDVRIIEDINEDALKSRHLLGISVRASYHGETVDASFLAYNNMGTLEIYDEIH